MATAGRTTPTQGLQSISVLLLNLKVSIEEVQPPREVRGSVFCRAWTEASR